MFLLSATPSGAATIQTRTAGWQPPAVPGCRGRKVRRPRPCGVSETLGDLEQSHRLWVGCHHNPPCGGDEITCWQASWHLVWGVPQREWHRAGRAARISFSWGTASLDCSRPPEREALACDAHPLGAPLGALLRSPALGEAPQSCAGGMISSTDSTEPCVLSGGLGSAAGGTTRSGAGCSQRERKPGRGPRGWTPKGCGCVSGSFPGRWRPRSPRCQVPEQKGRPSEKP